MKLPDHMTIHCPVCGAEEATPITYDWTLEGNRIQVTVNLSEDSQIAKHVFEKHVLIDTPPTTTPGVDGEAAPVVTDDSGRTHVVSRPVPLDHAPGGCSDAPSGSSSQAETSLHPDLLLEN